MPQVDTIWKPTLRRVGLENVKHVFMHLVKMSRNEKHAHLHTYMFTCTHIHLPKGPFYTQGKEIANLESKVQS